jgi:hypothetical protein
VVANGSGGLVELLGESRDVVGDRRVGQYRHRHFTVEATGRAGIGPVRQRVTEELPADDTGDHHNNRHQCGDHTEADAAASRCHRAVAAGPFGVDAVAAGPFRVRTAAAGRLRGESRWRILGFVGAEEALVVVLVVVPVLVLVIVEEALGGFGAVALVIGPGVGTADRSVLGFVCGVLGIRDAVSTHACSLRRFPTP